MDRNYSANAVDQILPGSLSARRAWIEIVREVFANFEGFVALRKESVDRNLLMWYQCNTVVSRSPQGERG